MLTRLSGRAVLVAVAILAFLAVPGTSVAAKFKVLSVKNEQIGTSENFGMARTPDGVLHLIFATHPTPTATSDGLAAIPISPSGAVGSTVQALSGYNPLHPAMIAQGSTIEAFFSGVSPDNLFSVFGITSSDGGATWSAPGDVLNHDPDNSQSYAAGPDAALMGSTPVLALPHNDIVIQQGLGPTAPTSIATDGSDNSTTDATLAVDAASGAVVAGWPSNAGSGATWLNQVAPTVGTPQMVPGPLRNQLVVAGRSTGPGVFAAYSPDNKNVRLLRYGGGSVALGSAKGVTPNRMGVATGPGGRLWVMWGAESQKIAVTRSNKAVTRFEPIQRIPLNANGLARLSGDGQLGPLDLLADGLAPGGATPATMYARVLAELSAKGSLKKGKLKVTVTDAGDPVSGAKVKAAGKTATTNGSGLATLSLGKSVKHVTVKITAPGYNTLKLKV
jgi:hypothetical protein